MTARSSGTWTSGLTADEFAAVRSVGFEPVGQVFGAAVYGVGPLRYTCPATVRPAGNPAAQVSGRREAGSYGPLVQARYQARDQALARMTAECRDLGGHGVVGVQVSRGAFLAGGVQFTATGTAVRASGTPVRADGTPGAAAGPPVPFASGLTGQDFAKLITAGWVPAGLVLGISIGSRHDDRDTARQVRWTAGNTEVAGWTELVNESRRDARRQLEQDLTRSGADGVVITALELHITERDCPAHVGRRDHIAEATVTGTAIARFAPTAQHSTGPTLTIMSLDPQRRQTARIRI